MAPESPFMLGLEALSSSRANGVVKKSHCWR